MPLPHITFSPVQNAFHITPNTTTNIQFLAFRVAHGTYFYQIFLLKSQTQIFSLPPLCIINTITFQKQTQNYTLFLYIITLLLPRKVSPLQCYTQYTVLYVTQHPHTCLQLGAISGSSPSNLGCIATARFLF